MDDAKVMQIVTMKAQMPLTLDRHTALLVIDMQQNFVRPTCEFARVLEKLVPGATEEYFSRVQCVVLPNVQRLLGEFRKRSLPVFFTATGTQVAHGHDLACWLQEFDTLGMQLLGGRVWPQAGETAWQIDESVAPLGSELLVNKTAADPLTCTAIDQSLRNLGVQSVVVCGLTTDVCVSSAARGCADRGYRAVIVGDACTTLSLRLHQACLDIFQLAFGSVRSTTEVIDAFPQAATVSV
jgi:nicotinamidase-related amidase